MVIRYVKAAVADIRRQPVLGVVSVIGTTLAIYLIMMVTVLRQVNVEPFSPESNRDRFLHASCLSIQTPEGYNNGCASYPFTREYYYAMTSPEAVTSYMASRNVVPVSLPGEKASSVEMLSTDGNFWQVFDFRFIDGKPYTQEQFESEQREVVLTESVARRLFGTAEGVAGREVLVSYTPFRVSGVVKDVSSLASKAYAQIWTPYLAVGGYGANGATGSLACTILARSRADFPAVREEFARRMESISTDYVDEEGNPYFKVDLLGRPYDQAKESCGQLWANMEPDYAAVQRKNLVFYLILLLVPAINLSEMTRSRMRRRYGEIGVRRAFGCTRMEVVRSVLAENLVVTLISGIMGLALTFVTCLMFGATLFASVTVGSVTVLPSDLIHWSTFGWVLLFCFILNLLSAGLPALRASRVSIVNALSK